MRFTLHPTTLKLSKMKNHKRDLVILFLAAYSVMVAQTGEIKSKEFFTDERTLEVKLSTDIKKLAADKKSMAGINGTFSCKFPDSSIIEETVLLKPRGIFRKEHCYLASLMVHFNVNKTSKLAPLKKLKMVGGCGKNWDDEQFLLKEYLIYKMYNLLTDFSFRVRLMKVNYEDTKGKVKPYSQYAFVIEDIDQLAKRNKYQKKELIKFGPNGTNRNQTLLMSVFQYMIGNTDWSIPYYHNIKLVVPKSDTNALPIPIAYDFDVSGLVNPPYATPPPDLGIERVTDRLFRGYAPPMEELQPVIDLFLQKEKNIFSLVNNCSLLNQRTKKDMNSFVEDFYTIIKDKSDVKNVFITNARRN